MALVISPSGDQKLVTDLPRCFSGSAIRILNQEDLRPLDIPASGPNWTYDSSSQIFKKTGGGSPVVTSAQSDTLVYGKQPFYILGANINFVTPGVPNNNSHCYIGVRDDANTPYFMEVMKYCNNQSCGAVGGSNWVLSVRIGYNIVHIRSVNYNEKFYVRSDGVNLYFEHIQGGVTITDHVIALPETTQWKFEVGAIYQGNEFSLVSTYKGYYQGAVPIGWYTVGAGATLTGAPNGDQCFSAPTPGTYQICIVDDYDPDPLCVNIEVDDLYFNPIDYECGACIFTNQTIEFESNAGLAGTLTVVDGDDVPQGTVIDALHWQAPNEPVTVTATYTLGSDSITCEINVIEEFEVTNVEGDTILGLVPGDTFQLKTNYDNGGEVIWENINCQNLVSSTGLITIPKNYRDTCFGSVDCTIKAHVLSIPGGECDNLVYGGANEITKELRVYVEPTFPTPELGGPTWLKWKPDVPDFRVISKTFEGGCSETYIRNQVPTMRWVVTYDGLRYDPNPCETPCCDDPNLTFLNGIDPQFQNARVLDDFWMFVMGESGYFTLIDPRTHEVWRRVRFENRMGRDHSNWSRSQNRSLTLIWEPCCAGSPKGGECIHFTTRTDTIPPTVPTNLVLTALPNPSVDYGITTFTVNTPGSYFRINGVSPNPGLIIYRGITYTFNVDTDSTHPFQIVDNTNTSWTDGVTNNNISSGTLSFHVPLDAPGSLYYRCPIHAFGGELPIDDPPPQPPPPLGADTYVLTWDASYDNIGIKEYEIEQVSTENTTTWKQSSSARQTRVQLYSSADSVRVRAIDYSGNTSDWSDTLYGA
jgi:hypothetical protein